MIEKAAEPQEVDALRTIGVSMPLVVTPKAQPMDAPSWLRANRAWIEERLAACGAILFRGFAVGDTTAFQDFTRAISAEFPEFQEESSPRSRIRGYVMTSTDYPSEYPIQFHNEYSYSRKWPMKIYFCCLNPPATGGETPLADSRRVLERLSPGTRRRFAELGVLYKRTYAEGLGVDWRQVFGTSDRSEVEDHCSRLNIRCEWRDGDRLRTTQLGRAIWNHPRTGEPVWFNHGFFFNVRALEPESLRDFMLGEPEEDLSTNTYYGDGSPIEPETIEEIRNAYAAESESFPWQKGDVLLIDNMLAAHSRRPFSGDRRIAVAMAEPQSSNDLSNSAAAG